MSLGFSPISGDALAGSGGGGATAAIPATSCAVSGIAPSVLFGTPSASAAASASGFSTTQVGTPIATFAGTYVAEGISPTTTFGVPFTEPTVFTVTGVQAVFPRSTGIGKPTSLIYNYVPSASTGARLGTPKADATRYTCLTAGISPAIVFGQAVAAAVIRANAGAISGTSIGTPTCQFTQFGYVSGFKPTRLGQPRVPLAPFDLSVHVAKRERQIFARVS